jgi:endogenous inhibitor of DNA gyrase (YacG/DUF329 family)
LNKKCPICGQPVAPRAQNAAFPLCTERCRLIDLGRWLGEEYRAPGEPIGEADDGIGIESNDDRDPG